ncbi:MAG: hotdog domain-containing protein [Lachnospiraceae bacterium]|nr:hotdog domain-containing protein [Lachnospiraceae bacterium]
MPEHLNPHGTLFGGQMMSWMDKMGAMLGARISKGKVVTANVSEINFKTPALCGDQVQLEAYLFNLGNSSMQILVDAFIIPVSQGSADKTLTATAKFVFVHLDENNKPKTIPR